MKKKMDCAMCNGLGLADITWNKYQSLKKGKDFEVILCKKHLKHYLRKGGVE